MWLEVVSVVWLLAALFVWMLLYSYGEGNAETVGDDSRRSV